MKNRRERGTYKRVLLELRSSFCAWLVAIRAIDTVVMEVTGKAI